ncbi:MAG TPA: HypC/HybG/HupF family hydrogenase formation chaperone [Spirochaetota bacterium]|nr:HypC/HybG/HupF family hydrogenase formation chaperone [Spirochaetota bacterium]HQP47552.1 HypC/HybG/HupF family hydrogenase formation chaperone [Spirochaetota bacterium]
MCLAIPMKIIKINGIRAIAENRGVEQEVNISLVPDIQTGEKVLIHAGFVIERIDEETAREIEEIWDEINADVLRGQQA